MRVSLVSPLVEQLLQRELTRAACQWPDNVLGLRKAKTVALAGDIGAQRFASAIP